MRRAVALAAVVYGGYWCVRALRWVAGQGRMLERQRVPVLERWSGDAVPLPAGWVWADARWRATGSPTWGSYRAARHPDGRRAIIERRSPP